MKMLKNLSLRVTTTEMAFRYSLTAKWLSFASQPSILKAETVSGPKLVKFFLNLKLTTPF